MRLQYTEAYDNLDKLFRILQFKTALSVMIPFPDGTVTNLVDIDRNWGSKYAWPIAQEHSQPVMAKNKSNNKSSI